MLKTKLIAFLPEGVTRKKLAARVGISTQWLTLLIDGRVMPNVEDALRLAQAVNARVEDLWQVVWTKPRGTQRSRSKRTG